MPTATLKFSLPEEQQDFKLAMQAGAQHSALWAISQEVFRPARKHGYSQQHIAALLDKLGEDGTLLIAHLEREFFDILKTYDINFD